MKREDPMKWMHVLALSSALVFVAAIQIAAVSPALAVQPETKGSEPKPKKKTSSVRQNTAPQTVHDPPMDRKSYGY
jgi:hypothetical protein